MSIDPKATALVFPGQGSQAVGMGRELAAAFPEARAAFEEADSILGYALSRLMWEGPAEELNDTVHTQPALFVHSAAALRVLRSLNPSFTPVFVAGHSLGELSAIFAAGGLDFEAGLRLVQVRGQLMKKAGELSPGGMAAILGLEIPTLDAVCAEASAAGEIVQVANDNCPGQVVISGNKAALERAMASAKAAGAKRALPLAVSIAAHSPLMDSIQPEWNAAVQAVACRDGDLPVVGNVQALPMRAAADFRSDVCAQMQSRVRWTDSVRYMSQQGIATYLELGAGTVLGGLIKRIVPSAAAFPLGGPQDFAVLN